MSRKHDMHESEPCEAAVDLAAITSVVRACNSGAPLEDILSHFSERIGEALGSNNATVYLLSEDKSQLSVSRATLSVDDNSAIERLLGRAIPKPVIVLSPGSWYSSALQTRAVIVTSDPRIIDKMMTEFKGAELFTAVFPAIRKLLHIRSVATMPIIVGDSAVGLVDIAIPHELTHAESDRLSAFVSHLSCVLEGRRMKEEAAAAQQETVTRKEYAERLVETANVMIVGVDESGHIRQFNHAAEKITGYRSQDILGQTLFETIIPENHYPEGYRDFREKFLPVLQAEEPPVSGRQYEGLIVTRSGERRRVAWQTSTVVSVELGNMLVGFGVDITERRQMEKALQLKNQVFEDSMAALSIADLDGVITQVNPAFLKLWGYHSKEDVIGGSVGSFFINEEEGGQVLEALSRLGRWEGEFSARRADGSTFISRGLATAMKNKAGELIGYQSANLDVTEQKRVDEQLRHLNESLEDLVVERTAEAVHASQAKSEFLANMSHEFRTPLNSVIGFSDVLLSGSQGELNENQQRELEMIHAAGKRMLTLVNDILDISKIEAGGIDIELGEMNLNECCSEAVEQMRLQAEEKGIELRFIPCAHECARCGLTMMDRGKFMQVLLNLLSNAVKFTDDGSVELQVDCKGTGKVLVRVADTGVGIDEDALERVFDEFEQASVTDAASPPGTGLGLSISRKLANLLGGDITVKSTPGSGSEFTLELPLRFADDLPGKSSGHRPSSPPYV